MSHNLHDEYTPVGRGRGMNAVNGIGGNIHRALEPKCHIRAPQVIVNCLGKRYHVESFFAEHVGCFLAAVPAQHDKAAELQLFVGVLHGLHLIQSILIRSAHELERLARSSENGTALGENP